MVIAKKVKDESTTNQSENVLVKKMFIAKKNKDAQRYEFTPRVPGFTSYTVDYAEVNSNDDEAWQALQNAVEIELKKKREGEN